MFFRKVHMQRKDGGVGPIHVSENAGLSPSPEKQGEKNLLAGLVLEGRKERL